MTEERLGRIQAPTLVVWTTDDPTSEIAEGHFWADSIPGSRFELIEDAAEAVARWWGRIGCHAVR